MPLDHDRIMLDHQTLLGAINAQLAQLSRRQEADDTRWDHIGETVTSLMAKVDNLEILTETLVSDVKNVKVHIGAFEHFSVASVADRGVLHTAVNDLSKQISDERLWRAGQEGQSSGKRGLMAGIISVVSAAAAAIGTWFAVHDK